MGRKPQPVLEYVRLALLATVFLPIKFFGAVLCVLAFHIVCRLAVLVPADRRTMAVGELGKLMARSALLFWGYTRVDWVRTDVSPHAHVKGNFPADAATPTNGAPHAAVIVSNHVSYLDILVHMSHSAPSFVARGNTADLPLIGLISKYLQCIFVNRGFKTKTGEVAGVSGQVKERVELAALTGPDPNLRPLLLFPEGTTTNGRCLLPFKTGAFLAGAPVRPVVLEYGADRVSAAWESIDFVWHAFLMLANATHSVTAYELPVYVPSEAEKGDPTLYANNVRDMMLRVGGFKASPASLQDSRAYIALLQGRKPPKGSCAALALDGASPAEVAAGKAKKEK
ncbi:hypothetical protein WJX81_004146 [Elliptochloris bilobata]|uniref:Phospholipid/glycerol acyltransferase domain-containing protein n=1 Tax=Elliptochloris bilobata TaxID=381761 RepID=A0AAW1QZW9_9CHLO